MNVNGLHNIMSFVDFLFPNPKRLVHKHAN